MLLTCPNCMKVVMDGASLNTMLTKEKDAVAVQLMCKCGEVIRIQLTVLRAGQPITKADCKHLNINIYDTDHQQCIDCGTRTRWTNNNKPEVLTKPVKAQSSIPDCTCGALGALSHAITCPRHHPVSVSSDAVQSPRPSGSGA